MRYWIYAGASWLVSFAVILPLITRTEYDSKDGTCIVDWSSNNDDEVKKVENFENSIFGPMMEDKSESNALTDCSGRTYMYLEKLYIFAIGGKCNNVISIGLIFIFSFNIHIPFDTNISMLCATGCCCACDQNRSQQSRKIRSEQVSKCCMSFN